MHTHSIEGFRHTHVFLGEAHARNERKTWTVIAICAAMMVAEIVGGVWFGSVALIADGLHMSTHAGALLIAALAYTYSRQYAGDERFRLRNREARGLGGIRERCRACDDRAAYRLREPESTFQPGVHCLQSGNPDCSRRTRGQSS